MAAEFDSDILFPPHLLEYRPSSPSSSRHSNHPFDECSLEKSVIKLCGVIRTCYLNFHYRLLPLPSIHLLLHPIISTHHSLFLFHSLMTDIIKREPTFSWSSDLYYLHKSITCLTRFCICTSFYSTY